MKLRKIFLLISMLTIGGVNSTHAALTCNLNQSTTTSGNTGSAIGTFTIDKIGTLAISNFTAWNITITTPAANQTLTNSNSTITFADFGGTIDPVMVSTATSLTITPTAFSLSYPTLAQASNFVIKHNTIITNYYALLHYGPDDPGPGLMYPAYPDKELFFVGDGTVNHTGSDSIENAGVIPASLNLACTCVTGGGVTCPTVSAPIDFSFNHKPPETYPEEISIK